MTQLTAEMIVDLPYPGELQISPDGTTVAYALTPVGKKDEHQTSALWLAAIDGSRPARQFTSGDAQDRGPQWSPDGTQIAFLSDRATRGTHQLYLIARDGSEARPLTDKENKKSVERFAWSPGGGHIAFTSADEPTDEDERREKERDDADVYGEHWPYARLRLVSLATHEVSTLVSDDAHIVDMAWSPDGTELVYATRETPALESGGQGMSIMRVPIAGGEPQPVCHFPAVLSALTWASDGQTLLFLASVALKAQSSEAVYAVPAQGGEPRRIALGEESCAGGLMQPQGADRAAVLIGEGLTTRICWLDAANGALTPLSPTAPQDLTTDFLDWTVRGAGDQPWEVWAGGAEDAGQVATLRQISTHQTALARLTFGKQEEFRWTAPDGWELDGILVLPPDAPTDHPLPTVVLVHGGPYGRWDQGFNMGWYNWAQWLALDGYAVLMPNPRGGYGHGERFAEAARGDVGGADYADVMSAVDAAIARGIADPERLGIGGWSQGGFMTAWAVTQSTRFKAGIMGAGVSDWGMMVMTSDVPHFERELGQTAPWEGVGPHRHAQLSPISFAQAVKTPVLILHGEKDARVPLSQAIGFHRALREQGVPTEMVVYPREPHGIGERMHQIDVLRRVRSWYDRWLRA
jgi:dipeptidyl aminopeptidase/acylaminoacyl peptidase